MSTATTRLRLAARRVVATRVGSGVRRRPVAAVVAVAFVLRLTAIPLAAWRINPYSTHDATKFGAFAARIGTDLFVGPVVAGPLFPSLTGVVIYRFWGLLLAPFWALPGPSWLYAHVALVLVGVLAVYNVGAIGRAWHSPLAGALAALPVAVYPSFVLVHATLLREAAVLAGITTVARLAIAPPDRLNLPGRAALAGLALALAIPLRLENAPVYAVALVVGAAAWYHRRRSVGWPARLAGAGGVAAAGAVGLALAPRVVDYLARLRRLRTKGQSVYLPEIVPATVPAALAFAPIGAAYFLFTPFPWMLDGRPSVLVVFVEAIGNLAFAVAAIPGAWYALRRRLPGAAALGVGFVLAALLYGLVEGNVGTAVRHRQMVVWVLYLFGAVGVADWLTSRRA